jgi:hypothetical protein
MYTELLLQFNMQSPDSIEKPIRLASFDIGKCNFSQRVEEFFASTLLLLEQRYSKLPKHMQRRISGHMNEEVEKILIEIAVQCTRVQTGVYSFMSDDEGTEHKWDNTARSNFLAHLERYRYLWDTCDIFIIEQQFFNLNFSAKKKGKSQSPAGANVDAIKIAEATYMWFFEKYPFKTVLYFGSQYKTQIYGAPTGLDKIGRKKWATAKSLEFNELRGDIDMVNVHKLSDAVKYKRIKTDSRVQEFKNQYPCKTQDADELSTKVICEKQKLDDVSDVDIQAQAFKFRTMVACF